LFFPCLWARPAKAIYLDQVAHVVPWSRLVDLIAPHYPAGHTWRPPYELETMLRTHFLQQWFNLFDAYMGEAYFDTTLYREFVGLADNVRIPRRKHHPAVLSPAEETRHGSQNPG
jgi:IS5 family transposase